MSITGGLSWVEALEPLRDATPIAAAFMLLYIFITIFAILNVVTGADASAILCSCFCLARCYCLLTDKFWCEGFLQQCHRERKG